VKGGKLEILDLDPKSDHHLEKPVGMRMVQAQKYTMIGVPLNPIDRIDQMQLQQVVMDKDKEVVDTEEGMSRKGHYHPSWH
jgi:hypothetical protein